MTAQGATGIRTSEDQRLGAPVLDLALPPAAAMRLPVKLQWSLVGFYRACGAFDQAEALLDEILGRSGETMQWLDETARLAFAAGRIDEAVEILTDRANRSQAPTAWAGLARLHLEAGNIDRAEAISAELSRRHPDLVTIATLAADVARARGDIDMARNYYLGVLDVKPESVPPLLALARLAADEGDDDTGRDFLRRAIAASAEGATSHQLTAAAAIAADLGDAGQAATLRARAADLDRQRAEGLAATIRKALGDLIDEPEFHEDDVLSSSPTSSSTSSQLRSASASRTPPPMSSRGIEGSASDQRRRSSEPDASMPQHDDGGHDSGGDAARRNGTPYDGGKARQDAAEVAALTSTTDEPTVDPAVLETLRRDFGHPALRPGQASVINRVMERRDTLAIMPTGAGKSLTFQLPSMLLDGVTLVLSPLIALMKDQVEGLPAAVQERTALINSTLSRDEMRDALDRLAAGSLKLIYAAPERLRHNAFLKALRQAGVALVVVDEAHCVSMWGHDFRPDYLTIPRALPELGDPPVLAITATATPAMVRQIAAGFGREMDVIRVSVFRSNLFYEVHRLKSREEKVAKAIEIARQEQGAGIIYVSSRKDAEALANLLKDRGVWALPYHAGLASEERARNQELFMRGRARVVAATVAFGMGVDKADVRFIVHLSPPSSLEAYAQESGRAGRDGKPARCVLLVAPSDQASLTRNARRDELDLDTLRRVYAGIKRAASGRWAIFDPGNLLPYSFDDEGEDEEIDPRVALGLLEQAGLVRRHPDAPIGLTLRWINQLESVTSDSEAWGRFEAWLGPERRQGGASIRTAGACEATGLTPRELDLLLSDRDDVQVRDGPRATCLEILPVQGDAGATLTQLIERARADARRRIKQVMDYAAGNRCRHAVLAAHLGERLDPCRTVCDVCTGTAAKRSEATTATATVRTRLTAQDALAVLNGVRTLPYQMGKRGLTKLLLGSVESRGSATRAPSFGALSGFKKSQVERLIDRLIDDGFLYRDLDHEYKIITLTERGATATIDDLADYEDASPSSRSTRTVRETAPSIEEDADLDPEDHELLETLYTWRRERAMADAVPPYVIAHNSQLRNLAVARPRTLAALGNVPGFGPARVEKYGKELIALIERQ